MGIHSESEEPGDCDIYMFNREVKNDIPRERGFKVVVDIDDYWILSPSHVLYGESWEQYAERMLKAVAEADIVTTTNPRLAFVLSLHNPNVHVYLNGLPFNNKDKTLGSKMRFGYVGGSTHQPDVELLSTTFNKASKESFIYNNAEFILCGYKASPSWNAMKDVFESSRSYKIYGDLSLLDYMEHYDNIDVALVPLEDNLFNSYKSSLKLIEAASKKCPVIVSDVPAYEDFKDAPGVLWVRSNKDWLKHIRFCIHNRDWVKTQGQALYDWAQQRYDITKTSKQLHEILHSNLHQQS